MIRLGTAGSFGEGYEDAFRILNENSLHALEVEFTYGVRMKNDDAERIGAAAKKSSIHLSIHAPYYINLAAFEDEKVLASKKRIIDSCERAHHMGARYVVFHAGFYQKMDPQRVYSKIKEQIKDIKATIDKKGWNVILAPETTGKATQFGDIDELIRMKKETGCHLTVDFAHIFARKRGKIDYDEIMTKIKPLGHIHAHFSGIEYTDKGEKRHIKTAEEFARPLLQALRRHDIDITIINESPYMLDDAIMCRDLLDKITHK